MLITFPGLGLNIHISKIAFTIFNINIYWYAVFIVSSIILALLIYRKKDGSFEIKFSDVLELFIYLIPISIIFARLYFVLFNSRDLLKEPLQIFNLENGGIAIYGAIIGGCLTCCLYCKIKKIDFLNLLDYLVPCLALGQAIGRWGNLMNGEAYGTETGLLWRMGIIEKGILKEVHPTFLYESIVTLILFAILTYISKKRKFKGEITYIYLIIYSFARFFIEGIRIDSLMLFNVRISQALSLIIFVVFCILLSLEVKKWKRTNQNAVK